MTEHNTTEHKITIELTAIESDIVMNALEEQLVYNYGRREMLNGWQHILHGALTAKSPDVFRHTDEYTPQKWSLSWKSESQNIAIEHYNPQRLSGSNK